MKLRLVVILLVVACFLVAPAKYSAGLSETVLENDSNCDWSCWGGNSAHTFSVADSCAPDAERMKLLWKVDNNDNIRQFLVSSGYLCYITVDGLYCMDSKSAELVWKKEDAEYSRLTLTGDFCITTSIVEGDEVMEYTHVLMCYSIVTGELVWEIILNDDGPDSDPWLFTNGELIFTYCGYSEVGYDSSWLMRFYSLKTGELKYSQEMEFHSIPGLLFKNSCIYSEAINNDMDLYRGRSLKSLNLDDYSTNWEINGGIDDYNFINIPIIYDGMIYVLSSKESSSKVIATRINCINPTDGSIEWFIDVSKNIWKMTSINNDRILVSDFENICCYSIDSKKQLWKVENSETFYNIATTNNMAFCFDRDIGPKVEIKLICYDITSGETLWQKENIGQQSGNIVISNRMLFASSKNEGKYVLYCWGTPDSPKGSVHRITILPTSILINHNETYQFKATVFDSSDNELSNKVEWSVDPKSAGTITRDGLFTPDKRAGKCVIKATSGGKVAFALVTIVQAVRIKIEPSYIDIRPGEKVKFTATILDSKGKGIIGVPKMWSLSDPKLGEISPLGEFTAGKTGGISGNVFCTFGNIKGKAEINIINVNMENAVSFEPGAVNFGEIVSGHEKTLEITLKNNVGVPITVDIAKFGSWFEISQDKLTIPANSEKMIELTLTNTKSLKPGTLYIGKIRVSWDDGVAYSQVMVKDTDE
jgi:PQQ-like domain/Bacterial Ig-like domain (group 2)